jgi:hypothetical protein
MVLAVIAMLFYQYRLTRPDLKKLVCAADVIVALLVVLWTVSFIRDVSKLIIYIKVLSAFLLYFLGRMFYERILECSGALATSAYIVIYLNFIHRIVTYGTGFFSVKDASGDFYSSDTEMAFAMVLGFIFIGMFARKSVFKLITMFVVCPLMVFFSDAGIQMILFGVIIVVMLMYVLEVALHQKKLAMAGLGLILAGLLVTVFLVYVPLLTSDSGSVHAIFGNSKILSVAHMESRYNEWSAILGERHPETLPEILFGTSLNTGVKLKSLYLKTYYSLGIAGLLLSLALIIRAFLAAYKVEDRKSFYVTIMTAILVLGSGVTLNSMEFLQMSWFIMLFAGMVISSEKEADAD